MLLKAKGKGFKHNPSCCKCSTFLAITSLSAVAESCQKHLHLGFTYPDVASEDVVTSVLGRHMHKERMLKLSTS
jgi:hypothetical protein